MTRAMQTIQEDAIKLLNVRITAAVESLDWVSVYRLAEQLQELASRGIHRNSMDNVLPKLANINYQEREAR